MAEKKMTFSMIVRSEAYQQSISNAIADPQLREQFVTDLTSAVNKNKALQECDYRSLVTSALQGAALRLSLGLKQYHLVPFGKKGDLKQATFILGYGGMYQLAQRSGQYAEIEVLEVKEGELIDYDPFNGVYKFVFVKDEETRVKLPTIGYYGYFVLLNGFRKRLYWSKAKMLHHADRYSPAFNADTYKLIQSGKIDSKDMWKYSSPWYEDFDIMGKKTMYRQLLPFGPMSIEMQSAFSKDAESASEDFIHMGVEEFEEETDGEVTEVKDITPQDEPQEIRRLDEIGG